ncbi:hypothetical protein [Paraclostridium sordellii]|uniref:hypothetical protein n=1 Tax=Paraclostridium sordellii TaxID=1505 RepID=UPI0030D5EE3D
MKNRFNIETKKIQTLKKKDVDVYSCKECVDDFIEKSFKTYRSYYISNEDISEIMNGTGDEYKNVIVDVLPDKTHIKSGEFGEITATEIYKSNMKKSEIYIVDKLNHSRKEDTKVAAHKTDILIIEKNSDGFIIHSSEVKTKITDSEFNPIEAMIDGVNDDIVTRVVETLNWVKRRLKSEKKFNEFNYIKQVIESIDRQNVENEYNGAVFIDKSKLDYELNKNIYCDVKLAKNQVGKYDKELIAIGCKIKGNTVIFDGVDINDIYKLNIDSRKRKSIEKLYNKSQKKLEHIDDIKIQIVTFDDINRCCLDMYEKIVNIGGI